MKLFTIDFAGVAEIYADSEAEAMAEFRKWAMSAPGSLHLDGYNCIDEVNIED